jgi:hypothetical protein
MKYTLLAILDNFGDYKQLRMTNASFHATYCAIRQAPEQMTLPLFIEGYVELVRENDRFKKALEDCIQRTPSQGIMVQDMSSKPSKRRRFMR